MGRNKIFAFWEPADGVPGYVRACMRTWKYIPDSDIELLDFKSIRDWLTDDEFEQVTCRKMTLAKQSDCYRATLVNKYGGFWLDADTVITPAIADSEIFGSGDMAEAVMFGRRPPAGEGGTVHMHGAFVRAVAPHTEFLRAWAAAIPPRVATFRRYADNPLLRLVSRRGWRECRSWDYCVNAVTVPLVEKMSERQIRLLDEDAFGVCPERLVGRDGAKNQIYRDYYFGPASADEVEVTLAATKGMILLHNSWTPPEYLRMDEDEFLRTDTRLAAMLRKLL